MGSMVVAPVRVRRRDAPEDRVLRLTEECLEVELAQGSARSELEGADRDKEKARLLELRLLDTERRVRLLVSYHVNGQQISQSQIDNRDFQSKVFSGKSGGPTGLAVAISRPDYGPKLAWVVGKALEEQAAPIAPPPVF